MATRTSKATDLDNVRVFVTGPDKEPIVERYLGQAPFVVGIAPTLRVEVRATHAHLEALRYMGFKDAKLVDFVSCDPPSSLGRDAEAWCLAATRDLAGTELYSALAYYPWALNATLVAAWSVDFESALVHGDARHSPVLAATAIATTELYPKACADYLQAFEEWRLAVGLTALGGVVC